MTKEQFVGKAVKNEERRLKLPRGWWGTWRDIYGPEGERVRFSGGGWHVSVDGLRVSSHDSRPYAISKARNWRKK